MRLADDNGWEPSLHGAREDFALARQSRGAPARFFRVILMLRFSPSFSKLFYAHECGLSARAPRWVADADDDRHPGVGHRLSALGAD